MNNKLSDKFQLKLISAILNDNKVLSELVDIIDKAHFDNTVCRRIIETILVLYNAGYRIDEFNIQEEIRKHSSSDKDYELVTLVLAKISEDEVDSKYVLDTYSEFAKHNIIKNTIKEAYTMLNDDSVDYDNIKDKVIKSFYAIDTPEIHNYFDGIAHRCYSRALSTNTYLKTLIPELDEIILGLENGQVGVWCGSTGVGKSHALKHCARVASLFGETVLYYDLELSEEHTKRCFDSAISGIPVRNLNDDVEQTISKLTINSDTYMGDILLAAYPMKKLTIGTIRSHLTKLTSIGKKPGLVVIDYVRLMKASRNLRDLDAEEAELFNEIHGLAQEFSTRIWTVSQTNRMALNNDIPDMSTIGGLYAKLHPCDVVIFICRNAKELENNEGRFYIDKNRNGKEKLIVKFKCDLERSLLVTL